MSRRAKPLLRTLSGCDPIHGLLVRWSKEGKQPPAFPPVRLRVIAWRMTLGLAFGVGPYRTRNSEFMPLRAWVVPSRPSMKQTMAYRPGARSRAMASLAPGRRG